MAQCGAQPGGSSACWDTPTVGPGESSTWVSLRAESEEGGTGAEFVAGKLGSEGASPSG